MSLDDSDRRAWVLLMRAAEPPSLPLVRLASELGAAHAASAVIDRKVPRGHEAVLRATMARVEGVGEGVALDQAARELDAADRIGARLLTPQDDEWPGYSLLATTNADTADRGGAPLALWARGPLRVDDVAAASIAVVGSRASSPYGEAVTTTIVQELVSLGWGITSGAAFGIDGIAHRAALATDGATMAVVACGIDRPYPAGHSRLLAEIAQRGVVLSEYPLGTTVGRHRFLARNRLIAALSGAVVVAEAGNRSGAIATAGWAVKYARPLGAVPGPVTAATSVGCHQLIADGRALLVTDGAAISTLARPDGAGQGERVPSRPTDGLTAEQQRVHDAIPARGTVSIDEIAFAAALELGRVRTAIALLELRGLVSCEDGGWRLPVRRRGASI